MSDEIWARGVGTPLSLTDALEFLDKYRELANKYARELNQAKRELAEVREQIVAYQIAKDNLELRLRNEADACAHDKGFGLPESAMPCAVPSQVY